MRCFISFHFFLLLGWALGIEDWLSQISFLSGSNECYDSVPHWA